MANIIFLTSDKIAIPAIKSLQLQHSVTVLTKADKPQGRNKQFLPNEISVFSEQAGIKLIKINEFDNKVVNQLANANFDLAVVFSFGVILSASTLYLWPKKVINIHPSKLPQYRGASPIQSSLVNGDTKSALSYMLMGLKMDAGALLKQIPFNIAYDDNYSILSQKIALLAASSINDLVADFLNAKLEPIKQDDRLATYCYQIKKEAGRIDWHKSADVIFNQWRAYYEWPKVYTFYSDKKLILHEIKKIPGKNLKPGTVFNTNNIIAVQTNDDAIQLMEVQLEGKNKVDIKSFINGYKDFVNSEVK